jgi:hypothetical protein
MKTAKKVLSVLLSVMLVLGTVVIAVNAAYADPTTETATFTLKAEVFDATEGALAENAGFDGENVTVPSTTKAAAYATENKDVTAYKKVTAHNYQTGTAANPIKVKAGQIVWVTINIATSDDCFPYVIEQYAYYSTNMFVSSCVKAGTGVVKSAGSVFQSYIGSWTPNFWSWMNATLRNKVTGAAGEGYHGITIQGYPDPDKVAESDEGMVMPLNETLASFPLYVKADAAAGTTGTVYMNADDGISSIKSAQDGDYSVAVTDMVNMKDSSSITSKDVLYFEVEGDAVEVDYTALNAAIASYEALNGAAYTDTSWAAATSAYNTAKAALTSDDQATVDAAAAALNAAIAALEEKVVLDYTGINAALASVPASLVPYTTSTALAASEAKDNADDAKANATTQAELDNAAAALNAAVAALKLKADMTDLNAALAAAAGYSADNYTTDSYAALSSAVAAGQAIVANADEESDQAKVTKAAQDINDAISNLVALGADYSAVETQKARYNALDKAQYTTASKAAVDAAIAAVVPGLSKDQQATVDQFAADIKAAIDNLVKLANTDALAAAVAAANAANAADYTAADYQQLQAYVQDAAQYLNGEATEAQQGAIDTLTANINALLANTLGDADYTAVDTAKAKIPADLSVYTDASVTALNDAVNAVVYGLKADQQETVNGYAAAIEAAVAGLQLKAANLADLITAIAAGENVNSALYTADSYKAVSDAVAAGKTLKDSAPSILAQGDVDAAAKAINDAIAALVPLGADWSEIEAVIARADALDRSLYTEASLNEFDAAFNPVRNMYANAEEYTVADQAIIDAMVLTGNAAFTKLVLLPADYTAVTAAQDRAATYVPAYYPAEDWAAVQSALDAVETGLTVDKQAQVDAMAKAINDALDALEGKMLDADYDFVDRQVARADALTSTDYTAASWAAVEDALAGVVRGYKIDRQADVDDMADALVQAIRNLVPAGPADYTAVDDAIDEFENLDKSIYTDDSVAAVEAAIAAVVRGKNENFQADVDAMAAAINDAIDNLVEKTYGPADYTAVDNAIAAFNNLNKDLYTDESVAAVDTAIAAVERGLDEREQARVDAMAKAINDAIDALVLKEVDPPVPAGAIQSITYTESPYALKTYSIKITGRVNGVRFLYDNNSKTVTVYRSRTNDKLKITSYDADGNVVSDLDVLNIAYEIWEVELALNPRDYTVIAQTGAGHNGWESVDLGYALTVKMSTSNDQVISATPVATEGKVGEHIGITVVTGSDVTKIQFLVDDATSGVKTFYATTTGADSNTFEAYAKLYTAGEHTIRINVRTADGWKVADFAPFTLTATK